MKGNRITVNISGDVTKSQVVAGGSVNVGRTPFEDAHDTQAARGNDPAAQSQAGLPPDALKLALFKTLREKFSLAELEMICWEIGIRFEDLPSGGLTVKARELVKLASALGLFDKLSTAVRRERPETD